MTDNIMELAEKIATNLLEAGSMDGNKVHRIQFKGGDWPNNETNLGGFGKAGLVGFLEGELAKALLSYRWVDIETAPKDGSEILLFAMGDIGICYWRDDDIMTGWTWGLEKRFNNPTHWMPRPLPPTPQVDDMDKDK